MRHTGILVVLIFLFQLSFGQNSTCCNCKTDAHHKDALVLTELEHIANKQGHKIEVCGLPDEWSNTAVDISWSVNSHFLHSYFIVHDCTTGDTLLADTPIVDGYWYYVTVTPKQEILIQRVVFINYAKIDGGNPPIIISESRILLRKNKAVVTAEIPKFKMPLFSKEVLDSASRFYKRLEDTLAVHNQYALWIDYNTYPDQLLLVAAVNNVGRSQELYRNLRKYFDIDGDVSESYDGGLLDDILDNQVGKKKHRK